MEQWEVAEAVDWLAVHAHENLAPEIMLRQVGAAAGGPSTTTGPSTATPSSSGSPTPRPREARLRAVLPADGEQPVTADFGQS